MTSINTQEDFLRALSENPQWREAVRAQILGEELLQLPVRFDAFENRVDTRFNRMEGDIAQVKGEHARSRTIRQAPVIALDLDLEYVKTLDEIDLALLVNQAKSANNPIVTNSSESSLMSFRQADLVIATRDGAETKYITVEISFTADQRDVTRSCRNASYLTSITGQPALAVIASVRNDQEAEEAITSGTVLWRPIADRDLQPE